MAPEIARELCELGIDYVVVVRGSIFSAEKTRPDFHEPTGFNIDVCRSIRSALPAHVAVFLQGSIVDVGQAEWAINHGVCDAVEMTRAQIADPDLVPPLGGVQRNTDSTLRTVSVAPIAPPILRSQPSSASLPTRAEAATNPTR